MKASIAIDETPPLYWEARMYCEERDIPAEDLEKVRVMLAFEEFRRRIEPYHRVAARLMASKSSRWISSGDGFVRGDISLETDKVLKAVQDAIDVEAARLWLTVPVRSQE